MAENRGIFNLDIKPGLIVFLGSGETQPSSSKTHEYIAQKLPNSAHICILETPAGFELNSASVAGKIKNFLGKRLQNYQPEIEVIPARKRGTPFSPDIRGIVEPLFFSDEIILGPGSPTYCVRQLYESLAYNIIRSRHRLGATIFLSSAATIAFSKFAIPIYEIYKVGEDPFWINGLDFLGDYGLYVVVIPHWNNNDGGEDLDTSHCFIGQSRFGELQTLLPKGIPIIGIDDHTSLIIDISEGFCQVYGNDTVTILINDMKKVYHSGEKFPINLLGEFTLPDGGEGIDDALWQEAVQYQLDHSERIKEKERPPENLQKLLQERDKARKSRDWKLADQIRDEIISLGWQVMDSEDVTRLFKHNK